MAGSVSWAFGGCNNCFILHMCVGSERGVGKGGVLGGPLVYHFFIFVIFGEEKISL